MEPDVIDLKKVEEKPKVQWHVWVIIVLTAILTVPLVVAFIFYTLHIGHLGF